MRIEHGAKVVIASGMVGAYYYTIASAALGAISTTAYAIKHPENRYLRPLFLCPIRGALDGIYAGWTHPIRFIEMVWEQAQGRD